MEKFYELKDQLVRTHELRQSKEKEREKAYIEECIELVGESDNPIRDAQISVFKSLYEGPKVDIAIQMLENGQYVVFGNKLLNPKYYKFNSYDITKFTIYNNDLVFEEWDKKLNEKVMNKY